MSYSDMQLERRCTPQIHSGDLKTPLFKQRACIKTPVVKMPFYLLCELRLIKCLADRILARSSWKKKKSSHSFLLC